MRAFEACGKVGLSGQGVCRLEELSSIYKYQGEETCAADGMCQVKCPVKINTGDLIKSIRKEELGQASRASKLAMVGLPSMQPLIPHAVQTHWLGPGLHVAPQVFWYALCI
jgi:L-lactate utilization protein LutB